MARFYYHNIIKKFLLEDTNRILGELTNNHEFSLKEQQKNSWGTQISLLQKWLKKVDGNIIFEYNIPRMGRRIDCVIISGCAIFAIEFKVGSDTFERHAIDQVMDYALDLKNFHQQSHDKTIVPILICTKAIDSCEPISLYPDGVSQPLLTNGNSLCRMIEEVKCLANGPEIDPVAWLESVYLPTPTIIEAAQALYRGHRVEEISRNDAGAMNLTITANAIASIIEYSKRNERKSICFLTGVPGSGKTLAGLNLANSWHKNEDSEHAVFLSGNGPLVEVLREALARSEVMAAKENGESEKKGRVIAKAKAFIQNIHHFRDDALDSHEPPIEKVVIFDEAQRAWTLKQTSFFMKTKKGIDNFDQSEPEFLISVMDRHSGWATIVCLVGGGQEINTGEAGLKEWFNALKKSFSEWNVYVSGKLTDYEYNQGQPLYSENELTNVTINDDLHLSVSVRSFRSEKVSALIKAILDCEVVQARQLYAEVQNTYPIFITRELDQAKRWLRLQARGTERFGIVASSGAIRLKPFGINVKSNIDPKDWFLNDREDIRSSYFLEDAATEFDVQGLELDWTCVAWDGDLRYAGESKWSLKSFRGTKWQEVKAVDAKVYLINAYRVLLTRARQGMVIFIPFGSKEDKTREPKFYDKTYGYLRSIGINELIC